MSKNLLFTVCDVKSGRLDSLRRLLKSLEGCSVAYDHFILLQNAANFDYTEFAAEYRFIFSIDGRLSLSSARNYLLSMRSKVQDFPLHEYELVGFPDDDAWYTDGFLLKVNQIIASRNSDMFVTQYSSLPENLSDRLSENLKSISKFSVSDLIANASSNTIFVRGSVVAAVGYFDEQLGLGATINGGEDLDFALRCYIHSKSIPIIFKSPLVGHRSKVKAHRASYFFGSFVAIQKFVAARPIHFYLLLRKALIGVCLILSREIELGALYKFLKIYSRK